MFEWREISDYISEINSGLIRIKEKTNTTVLNQLYVLLKLPKPSNCGVRWLSEALTTDAVEESLYQIRILKSHIRCFVSKVNRETPSSRKLHSENVVTFKTKISLALTSSNNAKKESVLHIYLPWEYSFEYGFLSWPWRK